MWILKQLCRFWRSRAGEWVEAIVGWTLFIAFFYGLIEAFHRLGWLVGLLLVVIVVEGFTILMYRIYDHGGL